MPALPTTLSACPAKALPTLAGENAATSGRREAHRSRSVMPVVQTAPRTGKQPRRVLPDAFWQDIAPVHHQPHRSRTPCMMSETHRASPPQAEATPPSTVGRCPPPSGKPAGRGGRQCQRQTQPIDRHLPACEAERCDNRLMTTKAAATALNASDPPVHAPF